MGEDKVTSGKWVWPVMFLFVWPINFCLFIVQSARWLAAHVTTFLPTVLPQIWIEFTPTVCLWEEKCSLCILVKRQPPSQFIVKFNSEPNFWSFQNTVFIKQSEAQHSRGSLGDGVEGKTWIFKHFNFIFIIVSEFFECILLLCHKLGEAESMTLQEHLYLQNPPKTRPFLVPAAPPNFKLECPSLLTTLLELFVRDMKYCR